MKREMKKYGLPEPEFYEERDSFKVVFRNSNSYIEQSVPICGPQSDTQSDTQNIYINDKIGGILDFCKIPKTAKEIREYLNISSKRYVAYNIIKPLIDEGKLEYTNKNSINARNQKYKTK